MARYFVHYPPDGSPAIYWRGRGGFAGETFHYNLNLLAHALGDDPAATRIDLPCDRRHSRIAGDSWRTMQDR